MAQADWAVGAAEGCVGVVRDGAGAGAGVEGVGEGGGGREGWRGVVVYGAGGRVGGGCKRGGGRGARGPNWRG